ncbi:DNA repair protein RecO [Ligilactobacillus ceti]|uniref:DNA repair protein RecO n=1 Tax=Ligilactobacillus ceti TaxID=395085 RepID=UPI000419BCCF|nr:DNA repair protein RecO [Ligilactobacillus ceti]
MAVYKNEEFEGIIVSRKNYKERDMLVQMYTNRFGFKTFFVRGVRKRGFKLAAAILPFTQGTYIGDVSDQHLSFITTAKEIKQYQNICSDIMLNAYASYILNLAQVALRDQEKAAMLWYPQIKQALHLIDAGLAPEIITNVIEIQLLAYFGVKPNLKECVICQRCDLPFDYSQSYGGLLCQRHWHLDPQRLHLDQKTLYYLRMFSELDLHKINSIKVNPQTIQNLRRTLDLIYEDSVGIYLKTKKYLDEMNKLPELKGLD